MHYRGSRMSAFHALNQSYIGSKPVFYSHRRKKPSSLRKLKEAFCSTLVTNTANLYRINSWTCPHWEIQAHWPRQGGTGQTKELSLSLCLYQLLLKTKHHSSLLLDQLIRCLKDSLCLRKKKLSFFFEKNVPMPSVRQSEWVKVEIELTTYLMTPEVFPRH